MPPTRTRETAASPATVEQVIGATVRSLPDPARLSVRDGSHARRSAGARPRLRSLRWIEPTRTIRWRAIAAGLLFLLVGGAAAALTGRALTSWRVAHDPQARRSGGRAPSTGTAAVHQGRHPTSEAELLRSPEAQLLRSPEEVPLPPSAVPPPATPAPARLGSERASSRNRAAAKVGHELGYLGYLGYLGHEGKALGDAGRETRGRDVSPGVAIAPASPSAEGAAGIEARLLAESLRSLRKDHAPERALALVAEHDRRFPGGPLRRQADMVRAEALLRLGSQSAALSVLDGLTLETGAADRGLSLARAELRAAHAACGGAISDFDRVLAVEPEDAFAERALYGRAVCRAHASQFDEARGDLRTYLERFPRGDRRTEAERTLHALEARSGRESR